MISIIPYPKKVKEFNSVCKLNKIISIKVEGFDDYILDAFLYRTELKKIEGDFLKIIKVSNLTNGEYKLFVKEDNIKIEATNSEGAINALTTLYLLISNNEIPVIEIEDAPSLKYRGAHIDVSRHFFSADEIMKCLEELSLVKINYFHWHLSDDQGFRIESKKYPKLHLESKEYYSKEQIDAVVEFAKTRGIQIIPEIDLPGHTSAILAAYNEYSCFGKQFPVRTKYGIFKEILCPSKENTLKFIKNLLDEIVELFPCKYFHIGGDEAPKKEWKSCPQCNNKLKELGLNNYNDLQGYFTNEIAKYLTSRGKQAICWSDTLASPLVSRDIVIQYWDPSRNNETEKFINDNGKVIYSDMFEYYFDYPHSMTKLKKVYSTQPHLNKTLIYDKLFGMEGCLWTERVTNNKNLEEKLFPRIFAIAERAWGSNLGYKDFQRRLIQNIDMNIFKSDYTNPNWWDPKGLKRLKQSISYCKSMLENTNMEDAEGTFSLKAAKNFISKFFLS